MDYKVTAFIDFESENEGWQKIEGKDVIRLENNLNKVEVKIDENKATIEIVGEGSVILRR